jgi:hypothetical protein
MDHMKILKRAWHILWSYRALWVFGVILSITTVSWETSLLSNNNQDRQIIDRQWQYPRELQWEFERLGEGLDELFREFGTYDWGQTFITIAIGLVCLFVLWLVISIIARFVSEASLIRMVDDYEETGEGRGIRQGFRMGWSRTTWRLFLINLIVSLPIFLAFILVGILTLSPLLLWFTRNFFLSVIGVVTSIGMFFLMVVLMLIVNPVLSLMKRFFMRACALENLGVMASIRQGFAILRQNLKDVGIMWLITIGIQLGSTIVMLPIGVLLALLGLVIAGLIALVVGLMASMVASGATPWIVAGVLFFPVFILILAGPLTFLSGLKETYLSSTWTLTYRELLVMEPIPPAELPEETPAEPETSEDE